MFLTFRIIHIVTGVFWAGTIFFVISFLMPTFRAVGPDGAKVFSELRSRRMFNWVPAMALLAVISGFWLYMLRMGNTADWARTREAMTLGIGGITGLLAFIVGTFVMRPATLKADDIARAASGLPDGADKGARMAEAQKLRGRAMMTGRGVATLVLITVITMAVARYL